MSSFSCSNWRPAYFRVASDDINYRRFFNVNELARIRMEHSDVFQHTHRLAFDLIKRETSTDFASITSMACTTRKNIWSACGRP